ncbi:hypothetical protein SZ54_4456 [Rhizobium sp. UR51a]|nr:hypothetical protein SZ54_4456 [Rhizobium sp. UR51a]
MAVSITKSPPRNRLVATWHQPAYLIMRRHWTEAVTDHKKSFE